MPAEIACCVKITDCFFIFFYGQRDVDPGWPVRKISYLSDACHGRSDPGKPEASGDQPTNQPTNQPNKQ